MNIHVLFFLFFYFLLSLSFSPFLPTYLRPIHHLRLLPLLFIYQHMLLLPPYTYRCKQEMTVDEPLKLPELSQLSQMKQKVGQMALERLKLEGMDVRFFFLSLRTKWDLCTVQFLEIPLVIFMIHTYNVSSHCLSYCIHDFTFHFPLSPLYLPPRPPPPISL